LDVHDDDALDRLERSYEQAIDLAEEDPQALVEQIVQKDGEKILEKFSPEQLVAMAKRKAEKALRKFIPERRTYLQQRAIADAQALEVYPELKDPDSEFTKNASILAQQLLTGNILKAPDLLVWIGHAIKGYQDSLKRNGNSTTQVKSPEAKRIVESARTTVAPTPTRTRSFVERGTSSVNLEKATKKFEETKSQESAEQLVAAIFAQRGQSKRVEPLSE